MVDQLGFRDETNIIKIAGHMKTFVCALMLSHMVVSSLLCWKASAGEFAEFPVALEDPGPV